MRSRMQNKAPAPLVSLASFSLQTSSFCQPLCPASLPEVVCLYNTYIFVRGQFPSLFSELVAHRTITSISFLAEDRKSASLVPVSIRMLSGAYYRLRLSPTSDPACTLRRRFRGVEDFCFWGSPPNAGGARCWPSRSNHSLVRVHFCFR